MIATWAAPPQAQCRGRRLRASDRDRSPRRLEPFDDRTVAGIDDGDGAARRGKPMALVERQVSTDGDLPYLTSVAQSRPWTVERPAGKECGRGRSTAPSHPGSRPACNARSRRCHRRRRRTSAAPPSGRVMPRRCASPLAKKLPAFALPGGEKHGHRRSGARRRRSPKVRTESRAAPRTGLILAQSRRCGFAIVVEITDHEPALRSALQVPGS